MKIHFKCLAVLMAFAVGLSAGADETFPTMAVGGNTYTNVTVTVVTATDIYFTYSGGMGNAKIKNLSPELQQHFGYNAANAIASEKQQAQANAQYQLHKSDGRWGTDLPAALNQARADNKLVLMEFTGSDWCPCCMLLDQNVLSTSQFIDYARNNLELVKVDFPRNTPQSDDLRQANAALASRFNVDKYPTCILLDSSGKQLGRQVGYMEGGLNAYIAWMNSFPKGAKGHAWNGNGYLLGAIVTGHQTMLVAIAGGLVLFFLALKALIRFSSRNAQDVVQ